MKRCNIAILLSWLIFISCDTESKNRENSVKPIQVEQAKFDDYFVTEFELDLSHQELKHKTIPSALWLKGKFIHNDSTYYALADVFPGYLYFYNALSKRITKEIKLPKANNCQYPYYIDVASFDSIIYLDKFNQSIVIADTSGIRDKYYPNFSKRFHEYMIYSYSFSRSELVEGELVLIPWIDYGKNRDKFYVNYDSLMDLRPMIALYDFVQDSIIEIPVKPYIKRDTKKKRVCDSYPFYTYNEMKKKLIFFFSASDTLISYDIATNNVEKDYIKKSSIPIKPISMTKGAPIGTTIKETEGIILTSMFYIPEKNYYLRSLKYSKNKDNLIQTELLMQIVDTDFNVIKEISIPKGFTTPISSLPDGIYLLKADDVNNTLSYAKYKYY